MKTSQHGSHLLKLTRMGWVNCYLVSEDDGFTLVDTGLAGSAGAILAAASDHAARIVRITLTHGHSDHAGSLDALVARLPGVEVAFPAREARFLRGDKSMREGEPKARPKGMVKVGTTPTRELEAGERLGSLEVLAAPGHTPGQVAFLDSRDGTLIAGDAFTTLAGVYVTSHVNWRFPLPALGTWHRPTALASARELLARQPSRLAVGHGAVVDQPEAAMTDAIAAAS